MVIMVKMVIWLKRILMTVKRILIIKTTSNIVDLSIFFTKTINYRPFSNLFTVTTITIIQPLMVIFKSGQGNL